MNEIKGIIFFDVDRTLIDCIEGIQEPSEKTKDAIKKLRDKGYLTVLATGRPKSFLTKGLLDLGLHGYITSNGTYIEINDNIILNDIIAIETLKELVDYCRENQIEFILEGQEKSYFNNLKEGVGKELLEGFSLPTDNITDQWTIEEAPTSKIVVVDNGQDSFKELFNKFGQNFTFMKHPGLSSYDMYRKNYTKAYGIDYLIEKLGIDKSKTYAFGDGENDIEMFQTVNCGIAMGGSHENLLPHSKRTTESVKNEGIYKALIDMGLI